VAESPLDGHDVASGGDQAGGVEVAQVVEADLRQASSQSGGSPTPGDGVVVHRVITDHEEPSLRAAVVDVGLEVLAQDGHQLVAQVDNAFGAVLRWSYRVDAALALELPGDRELSSQEVDVTDLDTRCLTETQTGEGTQRNVGEEALAGRDP
jgi:hypothetical protein